MRQVLKFLCIVWLFTRLTLSSEISPKDSVGILAVDESFTLFADGRLVGRKRGLWYEAKSFSFPSKTRTIALFVINTSGPGGFIGVFSNGIVTDSKWKCKETNNPEHGWEQTNFTDDTWPFAFIRYKSSELEKGIPPNVHWISPANHYSNSFICRRRFNTEETNRNNTLISILGNDPNNLEIMLYLDGVFSAKAIGSLTVIKDQHELQAIQVQHNSSVDVSFLASSSNGIRSDKWWKCANIYHEGWFLPSYNDTLWKRPSVLVGEVRFLAPDAKWIGYLTRSNKLFCRRNIIVGKEISRTHHVQGYGTKIITNFEWKRRN